MTDISGEVALLDTDVLLHVFRNDVTGQMIEQQYLLGTRQERPLLSTVVEAEVKAFAAWHTWGKGKLARLDKILSRLVRVEAGLPEVVQAYVELYPVARQKGQAIATHNQNDLWIAATARATNSVLYTCDKDFLFLHPQHVTVRHIRKP
jgi:predicted nucleic acid-binding protein